MWIDRAITPELQELARTFPVVALVGPRQVGKTSLLERVFPDYAYASLDVAAQAEAAETRPQDFLKRFPPPVVLDEIQYAPSFFRFIKTEVDKQKGENGLFIITGSQNFMLLENLSESLAGRAAVVPFLGLSGKEWSQAREISRQFSWQDFLFRGTYPALWAEPDAGPSRERWYQGYVSTYLERDVRNLLHVGSLRDFERFIRACAARCGQLLNLSELGRDVGISSPTAKQWLSVLQASNVIYLLEPYYRSKGKRISKSPKLYFKDTGLVAYLLGFPSAETLWASKEAGALWETHVVNQWLRWRDWHEPSLGLWHWRDQGGNKVDLLIERGRRLIAVECKLKERPASEDLKGIQRLQAFYGRDEVVKAYLACPVDMPFDLEPGITVTPGWEV
ncbi:MAG: ATP-binding protein [Desulfohalobiaceae bacterium]|nr:ATP-binding protein [Desulfohalobiaceae bacterium]